MKKSALLLLFLLIITGAASAQNDSRFDETVSKGINEIYGIHFSEAERTFRALMADYPNHPAGRFFLAMIDWWKILLDVDNESYDDMFFARLEDVIFMCDEILEKDPENVDALFFKGGAIGFRGRLRALRESWIKAADDGREALPIVNRAYKINPNNVDVQLGFGIYNYYASVIPDRYPFIKPMMIFFPKGDKQKGILQLQNVAENGKYAKLESQYFLMTLFYQFEENYDMALRYSSPLTARFPENPIFERYKGRIEIRRGGYSDGYSTFRSVYDKCVRGLPGYSRNARREASYYIAFNYKNMGQTDSSLAYFKECENISRQIDGDKESGFQINAVLYQAIIYEQMGNDAEAASYYRRVLDLREYGDSHRIAQSFMDRNGRK